MFNSLRSFSILYFGLLAIFMVSVLFELSWLHLSVKPMFMVALMAFHYTKVSARFTFFSKAVQFGLFFSWLGDIALMFDEQIELFFVLGLGAFLIAHVGYALGFLHNVRQSSQKVEPGKSILISIPFALFTGCFFFYMKEGLPDELFIPVLAYTVVISLMGISSALRHGHVQTKTFQWILAGAVLFILSDCVIAINKFVIDFEYDAILNMFLYIGGQYMITVGAIYQTGNLNSDSADS